MGPIENSVYRKHARLRVAFVRAVEASRGAGLHVGADGHPPVPAAGSGKGGLAAALGAARQAPPVATRIAVELAMARMLDGHPDLLSRLRQDAPVILIDVPDATALDEVHSLWRPLLGIAGTVLHVTNATAGERQSDYEAAVLFVDERPRRRKTEETRGELIRILAWGIPILAFSQSAATHVPETLLAAARHHLVLPALDGRIVAASVRLVTGGKCRESDLRVVADRFELEDLAIALRHDRSPADCLAELGRLQGRRRARRGGAALPLDDLHGLDLAVEWARGALHDLGAWQRGEIQWSDVNHGIVLNGPPGVGKTVFAQAFANAAKLPLTVGSLSRWQSAGHLGDLLKAMRKDFDDARARSPGVLFVDEIDSFGDRALMSHDQKDYSIQVVNGFIEQLDGVDGREGLFLLGASNDVRRCDPAILRSGRLNRIVQIALPDQEARAAMIRVRLGSDLPDVDLASVARMADRMTGADVERLVKEARQLARRAGRPLRHEDLLDSLAPPEPSSPDDLFRTAVHEGGHGLVAVLLQGPDDVTVVLQSREGVLGWVSRTRRDVAGTRSDMETEILICLAGRAAEELVLGEAGCGAGGRVGSDLHAATTYAAAMAGSWGLAGPARNVFLAPSRDTDAILASPAVLATVTDILDRLQERVRGLLAEHRTALGLVAERLLERRHLDGREIAALIAEAGVRSTDEGAGPEGERAVGRDGGAAEGDVR